MCIKVSIRMDLILLYCDLICPGCVPRGMRPLRMDEAYGDTVRFTLGPWSSSGTKQGKCVCVCLWGREGVCVCASPPLCCSTSLLLPSPPPTPVVAHPKQLLPLQTTTPQTGGSSHTSLVNNAHKQLSTSDQFLIRQKQAFSCPVDF